VISLDFITKGSVKTFLKQNKKRVATATYEKLDSVVEELLKNACERAEKNGRHTVMPQDL
jgi:histone H3/H4